MNPQALQTATLKNSPFGEQITRIIAAAIRAVDPVVAVQQNLRFDGDSLYAGNHCFALKPGKKVFLIAFGKASIPMSQSAMGILGTALTNAIVITKHTPTEFPLSNLKLQIFQAGHPIPNNSSQLSTQAVIELLKSASSDDLIIFLISGGGSALLSAPVAPIALNDLQTLNTTLLACGATITEINTIRKHLSLVKGGKLAELAFPANSIALILSDVIGDPLDAIASGPTVADPSTYADALAVINHYAIAEKIPESILHYLEQGVAGNFPETPKPGNQIFANTQNVIIGNNQIAAKAALAQASLEGLHTMLLTTQLQGEARQAGGFLAAIAHQIHATGEPISRPVCLIAGGETTVTLRREGLGGRNQEVALGAARSLAGLENTYLLTFATDGEDGPTDAAGAIVSGDTLKQAQQLGNKPEQFLARNDSYHFFEPLGDLLKPGSTLTNVNDLNFVFVF